MSDGYIERMLSDGEKIVLIQRQHWLKLAQYVLVEVLVILAIVAAVAVLQVTLLPLPLISLGYLLALIPLANLLRKILLWSNHKFVVTGRRVIEVYGIFSKNVTDSSLEKVNDVNMEQSFWGRLFNYGDIAVITGSDVGVDQFEMIARPIEFKKEMLNAKQKLGSGGDERQPARDIPGLIDELDRLRKQGAITEAEFQRKKQDLLNQL